MSAVNVLAVLSQSAAIVGNLPELPGYNGSILTIDDTEAERIDLELTQARAAVAELIEAAGELDEELDGPPIAHRLRAAIARVTGAQS